MVQSDVFNLNGMSVTIRVNGEVVSSNEQATSTLGQIVQRHASSKGIRSASVFAGDRKLYTTDSSKTLQELGVSELNIVTKDQRAVLNWIHGVERAEILIAQYPEKYSLVCG